jgi:hypothetical protein
MANRKKKPPVFTKKSFFYLHSVFFRLEWSRNQYYIMKTIAQFDIRPVSKYNKSKNAKFLGDCNLIEAGHDIGCKSGVYAPFTGQLTDFVGAIDGDRETRYNANPAPNYYFRGSEIVNEPRYVLVQFTGMKDKNGVEI